MALTASALAEGVVVRLSEKRGVSHKTGEPVPWVMRFATIIGDNTLIEAQYDDDKVAVLPPVGGRILARIDLTTFRNDVQATIGEVLDLSE